MNENTPFSANPPGITKKISGKHIFIAGAGGLGSNAAMLLVRAGANKFTIIDFDKIEQTNLNRQFYFRNQLGIPKVEALKHNLLAINPDIEINIINKRLTEENCSEIIPKNSDIVLECFDSADSKAMIASFMIRNRPETPAVVVSGLAGAGPLDTIQVREGPGNLTVIGDLESEATPKNGTLSTRVMCAAATQAHTAIQKLLETAGT